MNISDTASKFSIMNFDSLQQAKWKHPLLGAAIFIICLVTTAGNCLVVIAISTVKSLHNPTGYLIVSLALADLVVGMVVMPLNGLFEMTGHVWLLGLEMCDIFHAMDILASTSSIWSLCVIAVDRYMAGKDPLRYRNKVSKRRILTAILFIWLFSASNVFIVLVIFPGISFPAIVWWRQSSPHLYADHRKCIFTDNKFYIVLSSALSFYVPMVILLFAYGKVLVIATQHSESLKSGIKRNAKKMDIGTTKKQCKTRYLTGLPMRFNDYHAKDTSGRYKKYDFLSQTSENMSPFLLKSGAAVREKSRQMIKYMQEQRAARTLFVVVGVFIICWMPFFICSPIITFCKTCLEDKELIYSLATWAGHINSMLNPIIYSRFSREFRRAFKKTLTCGRRRGVRLAMNTSFDFVFAQLIAVTHFWDTITEIHK